MSLLELEVDADSVVTVLDGSRTEVGWSGSLQSLWRAAGAAARTAVGEYGGAPAECTIVDLCDVAAIWDQETLGAACAPLAGAESFADRVHGLRHTDPHLWAQIEGRRYAVGTLGGYLIARSTRGVWHAVSAPGAERIGLAALTDVPAAALPDVLPAGTRLGHTDRSLAGIEVALSL
ncbi:MAG TPA: hypothetical protein VFJ14_12340 [Nocardioidaceae bacterium]|nr:hypothetical protein [Nocardioidaceae bacterium]